MRVYSNNDTICAIATPPGAGGIGVVRISGPAAFDVLDEIWRGRTPPSKFKPRRLYLGEIDITSHESRVTSHDRVMAVKMPAPNTYTGQDVVELSCHGSQPILKGIVEACMAAGARPAGPGEFTRRAFIAGKMDLAQAEAVSNLINATGERAARLAASQLEGRLSEEVGAIISMLAELRGEMEASIDFPDEGIVVAGSLEDRISAIGERARGLADTFEAGRIVRDGARLAIVGRPNSGKSSILNRLAGIDRAIVHHEPGTTRDVVEESTAIDGVVFCLRDTAGMRDADHEVEAIGVDRTRDEIRRADIALAVFDGSRPFSDEDAKILRLLEKRRAILVVNKSDLPAEFDGDALGDGSPLSVSAATGDGFDRLTRRLAECVLRDGASGECVTIASERHRDALMGACRELECAKAAHEGARPAECIAQHLRIAHESLGSITGETATDALLDRIFSTFCIGK